METITNRGQITNPYAQGTRAEYKMGSIEKFMHDTLGFRTGYDQYNEQMDNASREWETQNQSLQYEENYNSPEAQAARMRAAGLNPDIAPGEIAPGEAGEMTERENVPDSPMGQDMEALEKAGEGAAGLAMFLLDMGAGVTSIASTMRGIKNMAIEGENAELLGSAELMEAVEKAHQIYGNLNKEGEGLTYASGRYVGKAQGYTGRRLDQFTRLYDDIYSSVPVVMKNKENINALTRTNWTSENIDMILGAEKLGIQAAANKALVEATRNRQIADVLEKYPEFTKEELLAGNAEAIANAKAAGNEAKISGYREKAEKAIQEVNEVNAKADKELAEQDNEIIKGYYDEIGKMKWYDVAFPAYGFVRRRLARRQYERASRRKYGRNNDVKDSAEKIRIRGKL